MSEEKTPYFGTEMEALRQIIGQLDVIAGSLFTIAECQRRIADPMGGMSIAEAQARIERLTLAVMAAEEEVSEVDPQGGAHWMEPAPEPAPAGISDAFRITWLDPDTEVVR